MVPAAQGRQQVPRKRVGPRRLATGRATGVRQSPVVLSAAHPSVQEPGAERAAGSPVRSALNSRRIAGGATEATGRGLPQPGGGGRAALGWRGEGRLGEVDNTDTYKQKSSFFAKPL